MIKTKLRVKIKEIKTGRLNTVHPDSAVHLPPGLLGFPTETTNRQSYRTHPSIKTKQNCSSQILVTTNTHLIIKTSTLGKQDITFKMLNDTQISHHK